MVYPVPFLRLAVIGTLYGSETFTYSLSLRRDFDAPLDPPDVVPQGVIDAVTTFHAAGGHSMTSTSAHLTMIKLNEIGTDGRYTSEGDTVQHEFDTPVPGSGVPLHPPQIAVAVTLRTAKRRGRAHAGRFYLPMLAQTMGPDGRMSVGAQQGLATAATTFLDDLNAALPGYEVAVLSNVGTGEVETVTHVAVGRVVDTMRSRRTSLDEDYFEGAPLAP